MSIRNLDFIFTPTSVAVIGASRRPDSVGHVVLRNLMQSGFDGPVMPVNPKAGSILSAIAYEDVDALPLAPDLAVIATPPPTIPAIIDRLGARGTRGAIVITAGFGEMGAEGKALEQDMLAAAKPYLLRIVGPNCVGCLTPRMGLNASFAHLTPQSGGLALIAQSGAVITSVLDWAVARQIGFSLIASLGGMADVDFGDMLDYLAHDDQTRAVLLYVESITHARKFMSAARALSRIKPVVVIKAGRHEAAAKAATSHTGALAGADAVYHAAFRRAGVIRVQTLEELFDAAETLSRHPQISGDRLAIVSNGGGIGVLATDALLDQGGRLAELQYSTMTKLNAVLPPTWSKANPVDIIGDAGPDRYTDTLAAILPDPGVDAALVLNCPTAVVDTSAAAQAVAQAVKAQPKDSVKPVFTCWLGEETAETARLAFTGGGIPTYPLPDQAVRAFMHLVRYRRNQALLTHVPAPVPDIDGGAQETVSALLSAALEENRAWLSEVEAKQVLEAYGIPVVATRIATTPDEAAAISEKIGGAVAIKILSPDITHKSDVGGVALGLDTPQAVKAAAETMLRKVGSAVPGAKLDGFTVQAMVRRPGAHELIAGIATDAQFGPVILFGQGGTAVEIVKDQILGLPPLNDRLARAMIERTRIYQLLKGYRDRPAADMNAIADTLLKLSALAADHPRLKELDINPLWADAGGIIALDARIRVEAEDIAQPWHMSVLPYPRGLETELPDGGGKPYTVRPIRPDDAPALEAMLSRSSDEDIRLRFFSAKTREPAVLAPRLSQIDYDREMCFVAFDGDALIASARLAMDPDRERAEFALFVQTDHQGTGLGTRLLKHLISYAKAEGLQELCADSPQANQRMRLLCRELGGTEAPHPTDAGLVSLRLPLA